MNSKYVPVIASVCIVVMCAAYLLFLTASWQTYKETRDIHEKKIDSLLDRIPVPRPDSHVADSA